MKQQHAGNLKMSLVSKYDRKRTYLRKKVQIWWSKMTLRQ
jgi:hypothetical protein